MCGIAGIFNFNYVTRGQLPYLVAMTRAMRHRGPDDEGYMIVSSTGKIEHYLGDDTPQDVRSRFRDLKTVKKALHHKSILAMGHRRLSILDVSAAGHQPMADQTGRFCIVFNGEIYNYKELRQELASYGHRFESNSDTEVILAAYSRWGEKCLTRFNGDFALAIWDQQQNSLFCARDRLGIKPFYYVLGGERFLFGSDIKTIIASGLYRPEPDPQGLYLAMAFGIAPRPITAFKGVRALEQSHWMRIHASGHVERHRYWSIPVGTQDHSMTEEDAISSLDEQLQRAVARRLIADVPVGTFMSGGVDSTTVAAIAANLHPGIKAFTLGYEANAPELDEVSQAKATACMYKMQHIVEHVNPDQALTHISDWIKGYEEPFHDLAANYVISKLVKDNQVKVVLNGLGGDELFGGYGHYRYHWLPKFSWLRPLQRYFNHLPGKKFRIALSLLSAKPDQLHTILFQSASDEELRRLMTSNLVPKLDTPNFFHALYADGISFSDNLEALSYMDLTNYIGNHHVHRLDQFTMAHSIEGRFPFLDHELVEASFRIPSCLKISNNQQKYVLRRVAERYIAPECLAMKKKGFGLPLAQWMRGPLKPLIDTSLRRLAQRAEVQSATVLEWTRDYQANLIAPSRIWHLVALELWFEQFIDPGIPANPV